MVKQHISKDGSGYVTLRPQEDEDIWHAYNLIAQVSHFHARLHLGCELIRS